MQRGNRCTGLEDGTGGIASLQRAVHQRRIFIGDQVREVLAVGFQIKGRIAGAGKDFAGLDRHDDRCAAADILTAAVLIQTVCLQVFDQCGEGVLSGFLQADVNCKLDIIAGLRLYQIFFFQDRAVRGNGRLAQAVRAMKILLKGLFQTALADHGIHGIAQVLIVVILLLTHGADRA